jgi:hypothetical protein
MTSIRKPETSALVLLIGETAYQVTRTDADPRLARNVIGLTKADGVSYTVAMTAHGVQCSCPDFIFRREAKGEVCKHIRSLQCHGLLPRPNCRPEPSRLEVEFA